MLLCFSHLLIAFTESCESLAIRSLQMTKELRGTSTKIGCYGGKEGKDTPGQRNRSKHPRGFQTMTFKRLVESLFVDFLILLPTLVGFINSRPHSTKFIFPWLRLLKDSHKFNHFLNRSFIKPIENTSEAIFFCYPLFFQTFFNFGKVVFNECLFRYQKTPILIHVAIL